MSIRQFAEITVYSRLTMVSIVMATSFHVSAIVCRSWTRYSVSERNSVKSTGLWEDGPWSQDDDDTYKVNRDIYMYLGMRVLVVMSMVLLYCALATVLSYCCFHKLRFYRLRLTASAATICFIAGILTSIALVMYIVEIKKLPIHLEPRVSWSFGLGVIAVFCSFVTSAFVLLDYRVVSSRHYSIHFRGFHPTGAFCERF